MPPIKRGAKSTLSRTSLNNNEDSPSKWGRTESRNSAIRTQAATEIHYFDVLGVGTQDMNDEVAKTISAVDKMKKFSLKHGFM